MNKFILFRFFFVFLLINYQIELHSQNKEEEEIISMMEFYNADIKDVINYVSDVTGYTIVIDPSVRGKISIKAKNSITVKESLDLIESLLQSLGLYL